MALHRLEKCPILSLSRELVDELAGAHAERGADPIEAITRLRVTRIVAVAATDPTYTRGRAREWLSPPNCHAPGSSRRTVGTRSMSRSNEATTSTPESSAHAAR